MRCTVKKHFEVAAATSITLIVQVKDNQPTLRQQIQETSAAVVPLTSAHSHECGRNRDESRTVTVFDPTGKLSGTDWRSSEGSVCEAHGMLRRYSDVAAIIRVERNVFTRSAITGLLRHSTEIAFDVSNAPVTATRAAKAIRAHWRIENTSHYTRDVTMGEDRSRIRTNPGVFARLRSFAFNIVKANKTSTMSQDRYRAALAGIDNLFSLITVPKR